MRPTAAAAFFTADHVLVIVVAVLAAIIGLLALAVLRSVRGLQAMVDAVRLIAAAAGQHGPVTVQAVGEVAERLDGALDQNRRQLRLLRQELERLRRNQGAPLRALLVDLPATEPDSEITLAGHVLAAATPGADVAAPPAAAVEPEAGATSPPPAPAPAPTPTGPALRFSVPLRNAGPGTAFVRSVSFVMGQQRFQGYASYRIVPPGETMRLYLEVVNDRSVLAFVRSAIEAGTARAVVTYTDTLGRQRLTTVLLIRREIGEQGDPGRLSVYSLRIHSSHADGRTRSRPIIRSGPSGSAFPLEAQPVGPDSEEEDEEYDEDEDEFEDDDEDEDDEDDEDEDEDEDDEDDDEDDED